MRCPKCQHDNPTGSPHCQLCHEVLLHSPHRTYMVERWKKRQRPTSPPSKHFPFLKTCGAAIRQIGRAYHQWLKKHTHTLLLLVGLFFILGAPATYYFWGARSHGTEEKELGYQFHQGLSLKYLIGSHIQLKSRSLQNGQLDTPLPNYGSSEAGSVILSVQPTPPQSWKVLVKPVEWIQTIQTSDRIINETIALNHPSLKLPSLVIDSQGIVLDRKDCLSPRVGKTIPFLLPNWPQGIQGRGASWKESTEWVEILQDWKVDWKATFYWQLVDAPGPDKIAHLTYRAELVPTLWAGPDWSKGAVGPAQFSGTGQGDVAFDEEQGILISNSFSYSGTLSIPISDIGLIPIEQRIGRLPPPGAGEIAIQINNDISIRRL